MRNFKCSTLLPAEFNNFKRKFFCMIIEYLKRIFGARMALLCFTSADSTCPLTCESTCHCHYFGSIAADGWERMPLFTFHIGHLAIWAFWHFGVLPFAIVAFYSILPPLCVERIHLDRWTCVDRIQIQSNLTSSSSSCWHYSLWVVVCSKSICEIRVETHLQVIKYTNKGRHTNC